MGDGSPRADPAVGQQRTKMHDWWRARPPTQKTGHGSDPWVGRIPCIFRRAQQPTPVSLSGEPHGQRSLAGCNPESPESDMTEETQQGKARGGEWGPGPPARSETATAPAHAGHTRTVLLSWRVAWEHHQARTHTSSLCLDAWRSRCHHQAVANPEVIQLSWPSLSQIPTCCPQLQFCPFSSTHFSPDCSSSSFWRQQYVPLSPHFLFSQIITLSLSKVINVPPLSWLPSHKCTDLSKLFTQYSLQRTQD